MSLNEVIDRLSLGMSLNEAIDRELHYQGQNSHVSTRHFLLKDTLAVTAGDVGGSKAGGPHQPLLATAHSRLASGVDCRRYTVEPDKG